MCGRIGQTSEVARYAEPLGVRWRLPNTGPRYNLCPIQQAVVCRVNPETGEGSLDLLHFGLVPSFMPDKQKQANMIDAKSETVATLPSYRVAFKKRRGLLPVDLFYEWRAEGKVKRPLLIRSQDQAPMMIAVIWEGWKDSPESGYSGWYKTFSILTTTANSLMATIHDRMPVISDEQDWEAWLDEVEGDP
ncbi:SOS response-associated peptidase [Ferrovibrio sp. MS7]|uniref:SOS response-associated peptidase n=1 Tax=Ferrovibrio plantarum TaxID=3119164 RepID=UPI003136D5FF